MNGGGEVVKLRGGGHFLRRRSHLRCHQILTPEDKTGSGDVVEMCSR